MFKHRPCALFLGICLLTSAGLHAQVAATVTGSVQDLSGSAIPGASIGLRQAGSETNIFSTKTTAAGAFTLVSVPPGNYDLTLEATGFLKQVVSGLDVLPGRVLDV